MKKVIIEESEIVKTVEANLKLNEEEDESILEEVVTIVKKIIKLPKRRVFTIAKLINFNPQKDIINPLRQGKVARYVKKACAAFNIDITNQSDKFTGLAYHYKYKKN